MSLRSLIYSAKGEHRNMKQFAEEIGMSPAKLYRIADGDLRRPISDDDLKKIVDCAVDGSDVRFEDLKDAVNNLIASRNAPNFMRERRQQIERMARQAISESLLLKNIMIRNVESSDVRPYDFAIDIGNMQDSARLFFDVKTDSFLLRRNDRIYTSLGLFACSEYEGDAWYYLVYIDSLTDQDIDKELFLTRSKSFIHFLEKLHASINASILYIYEINYRYYISEICLHPETQLFSLGDYSSDELLSIAMDYFDKKL